MYKYIDAWSKLVVLLIKNQEAPLKLALLGRVFAMVVRVLITDYDVKQTKFNQRPYFRLFANWLIDLNSPDPTLDPINLQILLAFRSVSCRSFSLNLRQQCVYVVAAITAARIQFCLARLSFS